MDSGATLKDPGGLVDAFEFIFDLPDDGAPDYVQPESQVGDQQVWLARGAPGWDYRIVWSALPCNTAPEVNVSGTSERIDAIAIAVGPIVSPDGDCDAMEARHAVDLRMSVAIADDSVITLHP